MSSSEPRPFDAARGGREAALRETRRRLILDGAREVFTRDGLEGATMRAIAASAGCTTGAIYPLFSSKEVIYAELLAESLSRLNERVHEAIAGVTTPRKALQTGALAFFAYYRDRADEVALGLYLWHGVQARGLSRELDAALNQRLADTLDVLRDALQRLSGCTEVAARNEAAALFAFLIGALIVHQTGRLRTLGSDLESIATLHVEALTTRLSRRRPALQRRPRRSVSRRSEGGKGSRIGN